MKAQIPATAVARMLLAAVAALAPAPSIAQAFLYNAELLPLLPGFNANEAWSIRSDSAAVQIAGDVFQTADTIRVPVQWERPLGSGGPWTVTQLPVLSAGRSSRPTHTCRSNLTPIIVGWSRNPAGIQRAVVWEKPGANWGITELPMPGGWSSSLALGAWRSIDDHTQPTLIIGSGKDPQGNNRALMFSNDAMDATGWTVTPLPGIASGRGSAGYSINWLSASVWEVSGSAADSSGEIRPVIWTMTGSLVSVQELPAPPPGPGEVSVSFPGEDWPWDDCPPKIGPLAHASSTEICWAVYRCDPIFHQYYFAGYDFCVPRLDPPHGWDGPWLSDILQRSFVGGLQSESV